MILVVWFRNGDLYKAQVCSPRSWRRTANRWNEWAQLWNKRFGYDKNLVGVIPGESVLELVQPHKGVPSHLPKEILAKQRRLRELMTVAPWGNWKN